MTQYTKCDKCGKELEEGELKAHVEFEGHMMVREPKDYCIECWDKLEGDC